MREQTKSIRTGEKSWRRGPAHTTVASAWRGGREVGFPAKRYNRIVSISVDEYGMGTTLGLFIHRIAWFRIVTLLCRCYPRNRPTESSAIVLPIRSFDNPSPLRIDVYCTRWSESLSNAVVSDVRRAQITHHRRNFLELSLRSAEHRRLSDGHRASALGPNFRIGLLYGVGNRLVSGQILGIDRLPDLPAVFGEAVDPSFLPVVGDE